ncbi:MAG TPA: hypothetical protein VM055_07785 [Novosphingobium sp.]|nr:hypothetical protein [Novosphingobium sp.]
MPEWMPIGVILVGAAMFAWAERSAGDDRFLDEQRSYSAFPWLGEARSYRIQGGAIILLGLILLALQAWGRRG